MLKDQRGDVIHVYFGLSGYVIYEDQQERGGLDFRQHNT